jgi:hypothetical protein
MEQGTKSLLFGDHQFIIHPIYVTAAWIKCYKKLPNPKEQICIIIHDWGYWGKPNMDGEEGERHPIWAADFADKHFGVRYHDLCLYHSRFLSKWHKHQVSKLCLPDKVGVGMMPVWLWVTLGKMSGEVYEYMKQDKYEINHLGPNGTSFRTPVMFFRDYKKITKRWLANPTDLDEHVKVKEEIHDKASNS